MSLFWIKMIAVLTMAVDHIGAFLFPDILLFRIIGRFSFPLFAWAIANGCVYTKNIDKYFLRIFLLAVISQVPYQLLFSEVGNSNPGPNILFTFSLAILGIILIKKTKKVFFHFLIVFLLSLIAVVIKVNYGVFGVLSVAFFYHFYKRKKLQFITYTTLVFAFYIIPSLWDKYIIPTFATTEIFLLEIFSLVSLLIISLYNKQKGKDMRIVFYLFYPLHLFIIYFVKLYLMTY